MILDKTLLDNITSKARKSERLRMNYNLHDSLDAKTQRLFNALEPGTHLPIHRHKHTAETYILLKGRIDVLFYNDHGVVVERYELNPKREIYGVHIPKGQWHTIDVHESSVIFEVKDGPYMPIDPSDILNV